MRILITGGAGFIGSHLAAHCSRQGNEVRILDNLRTGNTGKLEGIKHSFTLGDVADKDQVLRSMEGVDCVFHLAAMVSVPESVKEPEACLRDNVLGTLHVLEAARRNGSRVIFASSAAVYGDNPEVPKRESMLPEPKSPYAITKLDGEHYLNFFHAEHGLSCAGLRFFNVFGPRQNPTGPYASAVPVFIHRALQNLPITVYGDGSQTRDFIYVMDIVAALAFLAERPGISGIYNAGYGASHRIDALARDIIHRTGSESKLEFGPERAGDVKHSYASAAALRALGWKPAWDFGTALEHTIEAFRNDL